MHGRPSKSARKREQHALQALGEQLIGLPADQLQRIPLDEDLRDAIVAASDIKTHGALRRQRQLVGKMMRRVDPRPIREALDSIRHTDRLAKSVFRRSEEWRDRIVDHGPAELARFFAITGRENAELTRCVDALPRCRNRQDRRLLSRRIFREVHAELSRKMHNPAS